MTSTLEIGLLSIVILTSSAIYLRLPNNISFVFEICNDNLFTVNHACNLSSSLLIVVYTLFISFNKLHLSIHLSNLSLNNFSIIF